MSNVAMKTVETTTGSSTSELRRLSSFLEISQALAAATNQKSAMHQVLGILERHHGAVRSTIALLNQEEAQIDVVASEGLRVYLGRRLGIPLALLLGSMAIERMVAAAVAIVLAGAGLLYLAATIEPQMRTTFLEIIAATAVLAALGLLAVWWTPDLAETF